MKRGLFSAGLAVAVWLIACVGEDPAPAGPKADPNVPVGQFRGACTEDGKCLEGLVCTQGVCLQREDGGSGSPTDDSGSSAQDGATSEDAAPKPCTYSNLYSGPIKCSNSPPCDTGCCMASSGPAVCNPNCATAQSPKTLICDSDSHCPSGSNPVCCFRIKAPIDTSVCPSQVAWADFGESFCGSTCADVNEYRACRQDADCTTLGKKCRGMELFNGSDKISFGICH